METDFPTASVGSSQAPTDAVEKSQSVSHTEIRTLPAKREEARQRPLRAKSHCDSLSRPAPGPAPIPISADAPDRAPAAYAGGLVPERVGLCWPMLAPPHSSARAHPHCVDQIKFGEPFAKDRLVTIGRIGKRYAEGPPAIECRLDLRQRNCTLARKVDLGRNLGLAPPVWVLGPLLGQITAAKPAANYRLGSPATGSPPPGSSRSCPTARSTAASPPPNGAPSWANPCHR